MNRCMIAIDIQNYYRPAPGMVAQINQLSANIPTVATLFTHDEPTVPLVKFGKTPPMDSVVLVNAQAVFPKHGYSLPPQALEWLKKQNPEEVLVAGGHTDANVLAAGFSLFNAGMRPAMVPVLCYGNDWYMHTVTTGIWEREIGKLYQSMAEFQFGA
ncbi:MAG: isochorismatase family protein [Proteobacteria bacterium]|nr:isochorismatase family protein [Pseudomonadota bacterium]